MVTWTGVVTVSEALSKCWFITKSANWLDTSIESSKRGTFAYYNPNAGGERTSLIRLPLRRYNILGSAVTRAAMILRGYTLFVRLKNNYMKYSSFVYSREGLSSLELLLYKREYILERAIQIQLPDCYLYR